MTEEPTGRSPERTVRIAGSSGRRRARLPGRDAWATWIPYLVLGTGLVVTTVATAMVHRQVVEDDEIRFRQNTQFLVNTLEARLGEYEDALRAGRGWFQTMGEVDASSFQRFMSSLHLSRHPGLRAMSYAEVVPEERREAFEERMRTEGFEDFQVWPVPGDGVYMPVTYVQPRTGPNRHALGFDAGSSDKRRRVFERACETGEIQVTPPVELATAESPTDRLGFVMALPVYRHGLPGSCEEVRGYMNAVLERTAFFDAIADALPAGQVHFTVQDEAPDGGVLYRTSDRTGPAQARFDADLHVREGGRMWTVRTWPGPAFDELSQQPLVPFVLVTGVLISLALFGLVWSESRARARAEHVARDLYRSQEALTRADRAKDEFLAMLGHELRNPLSTVKMALDVLRTSEVDDPDARAALDVADRQMRHQTRLVDDLLDVSRVSRGKIVLKPERLDLRDVVADAVSAFQGTGSDERPGVTMDRPTGAVLVEGDPTRLEQVVSNLLSNAAKYSHEQGRVHVSLEREGSEAVLRVRDEGIGIEPEALERIFDLFAQEGTSLERSAGGLGIGLTLVKRLVAMHGGRVRAHSEGPGEGSEFEVRLPLIEGRIRVQPSEADSAEGDHLHVLVVEDNPDARLMLRSLLEKQGHHVQTASDGEAGVEAALEHRPDVALVDIGLPRMDGFEVARSLRRHWGSNHVELIAVTGYGQPEDFERSREAGFDQHLVKPVDPEDLGKLLSEVRTRG